MTVFYYKFFHVPAFALCKYSIMSVYEKKCNFFIPWIAPEILSYDPISTATDMW